MSENETTPESKAEKCFIIMPITTPENVAKKTGDPDHFKHVLECLFVPAIEMAGLEAVPPTADGSDVIQARIIGLLETADLVLCDMSCLNPNVFFELGIRVALNKPVAYVVDDQTRTIPFDVNIINHYRYERRLSSWSLSGETDRLAEHIKNSMSGEWRSLYEYFRLSTVVQEFRGRGGDADKLDYVTMKLDELLAVVRQLEAGPAKMPRSSYAAVLALGPLEKIAAKCGIGLKKFEFVAPRVLHIWTDTPLTMMDAESVSNRIRAAGIADSVTFTPPR